MAPGPLHPSPAPDNRIPARYISELGCLYAIEKLVSDEAATPEAVLQAAAQILPQAAQQHERYTARLSAAAHDFISDPFKETEWRAVFPLRGHGRELGRLELFRLSAPADREAPLLTEIERELIVTIADRLGSFLDQRQTQQELRISNETLRAQYKHMPIPTFTWRRNDQGYVLVEFNDAAHEMTRGGVIDMVGRTAQDLFPDYPNIQEDLSTCREQKICLRRELPFRFHSTGEKKNISVICVFVPPDSIMVHVEDITERKRAEQLRGAVLTISAEIAGCRTQDDLCRVVVEGIRAHMGIDRVGLFLSDPVDPRFHGTYGTDLLGQTTDEHHYFWDIRKDRDIEELFQGIPFKSGFRLGNPEPSPEEERDGVTSHLIALRHMGSVFGIISVDNRISRAPISEAQLTHISLLAEVFGNALQIAGARHQAKDSLEQLRRANEELESFNRAMVGRENRIIALKEEVNECLKEQGQPPRYPAIWNEPAATPTPGGKP